MSILIALAPSILQSNREGVRLWRSNPLQCFSVRLLPRVLMCKSTNHLLVVRRPCLHTRLVRRQMTDCTGKTLHLWLNYMAINGLLSNVEYSQRLHKVQKQRVLGKSLARANSSTKAKDEFTRVGFRLVPRTCQISFGSKLIWLWVNAGIMGKPPTIGRLALVYDQAARHAVPETTHQTLGMIIVSFGMRYPA